MVAVVWWCCTGFTVPGEIALHKLRQDMWPLALHGAPMAQPRLAGAHIVGAPHTAIANESRNLPAIENQPRQQPGQPVAHHHKRVYSGA